MSVSIVGGVEFNHFRANRTLRLRNKFFTINEPSIMGIVNITPDSFYEASRINELDTLDSYLSKCTEHGIQFIDLGAQSTRPGFSVISGEEQIERLQPYLERITTHYPSLYVSIDTSLPSVADWALTNGADMINDVEGGRNHPEIFKVCAKHRAPYVLVHSRGTSETLHKNTEYKDISLEVMQELSSQIMQLKMAGVNDVIVDLGFGFSKTTEENYQLLKNFQIFQMLEFPLLCGISRKSMIYKKLGLEPKNALNGTTVLNTFAILNNAAFLRVHDIEEAKQIIKLLKIA
jgi:dihydropteroate synthase